MVYGRYRCEIVVLYMARSSWSIVLYDFWALSSFREKKASGFQLLSTAQVRCVNGDASGASGTGVVAQLARVSLHQRLTDVG